MRRWTEDRVHKRLRPLERDRGWRSAQAKQRSWAEHFACFSLCFGSNALFWTYSYFRWETPDLLICIPEDYARTSYFASKDTDTMTSKEWMWLFCQMPCLQPPNLDDFAPSTSLGVLQIYFWVVGGGVERVVSILLLSPGEFILLEVHLVLDIYAFDVSDWILLYSHCGVDI